MLLVFCVSSMLVVLAQGRGFKLSNLHARAIHLIVANCSNYFWGPRCFTGTCPLQEIHVTVQSSTIIWLLHRASPQYLGTGPFHGYAFVCRDRWIKIVSVSVSAYTGWLCSQKLQPDVWYWPWAAVFKYVVIIICSARVPAIRDLSIQKRFKPRTLTHIIAGESPDTRDQGGASQVLESSNRSSVTAFWKDLFPIWSAWLSHLKTRKAVQFRCAVSSFFS